MTDPHPLRRGAARQHRARRLQPRAALCPPASARCPRRCRRAASIPPPRPTRATSRRIGWRDFFVDDRLRQVIQRGLDNNRDLRLAAANVLQARAQYRVQRADLLPTITASGSATYTNSLARDLGRGRHDRRAADDRFATSQSIRRMSASRRSSSTCSAASATSARPRWSNISRARKRSVATRISLIAEIATAWLTLASDQDQLALSQQTLGTFDETLRLTSAQFRIGVASELEVAPGGDQLPGRAQRHRRAAARGSRRTGMRSTCSSATPVEPALLPASARRCAREHRARCRPTSSLDHAAAPPRRAPGRASADRAERQYRRGARGLFPDASR